MSFFSWLRVCLTVSTVTRAQWIGAIAAVVAICAPAQTEELLEAYFRSEYSYLLIAKSYLLFGLLTLSIFFYASDAIQQYNKVWARRSIDVRVRVAYAASLAFLPSLAMVGVIINAFDIYVAAPHVFSLLIMAFLVLGASVSCEYLAEAPTAYDISFYQLRTGILYQVFPITVLSVVAGQWATLVFCPEKLASHGPLAVAFEAILALVVVLSTLAHYGDNSGWMVSKYKFRAPLITAVLVWGIGLSLFDLNDHHYIDAASEPCFGACQAGPTSGNLGLKVGAHIEAEPLNVTAAFESWLKDLRRESGSASDDRIPVYLVAAQGGGSYAAVHTAAALAFLQRTSPEFASHTFVISSVSGGAVGSLLFEEMMAHAPVARAPSGPVGRSKYCDEWQAWSKEAIEYLKRVASSDWLSPVVASSFYVDLPQQFNLLPWPKIDRSFFFEQAIVASSRRATTAFSRKAPSIIEEPFYSRSRRVQSPALVMGATEVETGQRVVFSPFKIFDHGNTLIAKSNWFGGGAIRVQSDVVSAPLNLSLSKVQVASISARFPLVAPAASIGAQYSNGLKMRLVDGGYYDNTGVLTLLDIIEHIKGVDDHVDIYVIVLGHEYYSFNPRYGFSELASPVRALLASRSTRGLNSLAHAQAMRGVTKQYQLNVTSGDFEPRLGWILSGNTIREIIQMARETDLQQPLQPLAIKCS